MTHSPMTAHEPSLINQQTGEQLPLGQEKITIGRKSGNSLLITNDPKISRHHAQIFRQAGDFIVEDLNSANGSFINEQRLTKPQILHNGDLLRFGDTRFIVQLPPENFDIDPTVMADSPAGDEDATFVGPATIAVPGYAQPQPYSDQPAPDYPEAPAAPPVEEAPPASSPPSQPPPADNFFSSKLIVVAILIILLLGFIVTAATVYLLMPL